MGKVTVRVINDCLCRKCIKLYCYLSRVFQDKHGEYLEFGVIWMKLDEMGDKNQV